MCLSPAKVACTFRVAQSGKHINRTYVLGLMFVKNQKKIEKLLAVIVLKKKGISHWKIVCKYKYVGMWMGVPFIDDMVWLRYLFL